MGLCVYCEYYGGVCSYPFFSEENEWEDCLHPNAIIIEEVSAVTGREKTHHKLCRARNLHEQCQDFKMKEKPLPEPQVVKKSLRNLIYEFFKGSNWFA